MATGQIYYIDGSESTSSGTFTLYTPATGTQFLIVSYLVSYGTSGVSGNTITFAVGNAYLISASVPAPAMYAIIFNLTSWRMTVSFSLFTDCSRRVTLSSSSFMSVIITILLVRPSYDLVVAVDPYLSKFSCREYLA